MTLLTRLPVIWGLVTCLFAAQPAFAADAKPGSPTMPTAQCSAMQKGFGHIQDAPTRVLSAQVVPAADTSPEYCQLEGYISPNVGFELRLPTVHWNGRYGQFGCGGLCGDLRTLKPACEILLRRGYACLTQDAGHRGSAADGKWAYNNLSNKFDWGVRALHLSALVGKYLTECFYGRPPTHTYFYGGSTGGRQALMFAQRFPWDFDGIVGQNPPIEQMGDGMVLIWNVLANLNADNRNILNPDDARTLHAAALKACDRLDGLADGIIGDPETCHFDPGPLLCRAAQAGNCLTAEKIAAARKIYGGPVNSKGEALYISHAPVGSELSWIGPIISGDGGPGNHYEFQNENFRYMAFPIDVGPDWDIRKFDWDKDYKRFGINETLYSANSPELRPFKGAGGKMILTQSLADSSVFPQRTIDYYERMVAYMGGHAQVDDFFRFFTIPGGFHNPGQNQICDVADFVTLIEAWVEQGKAPDVIIASAVKDGTKAMSPLMDYPLKPDNVIATRPLYPYPLQARYAGKGDPTDAANFSPVLPQRNRAARQ